MYQVPYEPAQIPGPVGDKKRSSRTSVILGAILVVMLIVTASLAGALALEMSENSRLKEDFKDFNETKAELNDKIDGLEGDKESLEDDIDDLEGDKESLEDDIDDLEDDIDDLEDEIDDLESEITSLKSQKKDLENEIAEWEYLFDMRVGEHPQDLVTPDDPAIISRSQQILGWDADGDLTWSDRTAINNWVYINIKYSSDVYITDPDDYSRHDYWQTPKETLDRGEGDCDDKANLALSLMLAEENVGYLWAAHVSFATGTSHVGIFANVVGDTMYVLDPTWGWESSTNMAEPSALNEWADSAGKIDVNRVWKIFSDTECYEFNTLQEFYDWF